jgi:hypothetical protein
MKTLICTCKIGDVSYSDTTLPDIKNYAKKTNSDIIVIDELKYNGETVHNEKFQFLDLIIDNDYDMGLFLDLDIRVSHTSPNIFNIFNDIAVVVDREYRLFDKYPNERLNDPHTSVRFDALNSKFNFENQYDYFNSGVIGLSKRAALDWKANLRLDIINPLNDYDQFTFNYLLNMCKYTPTFLDSRFNATARQSDVSKNTHYFIHYKGGKNLIGTNKDPHK